MSKVSVFLQHQDPAVDTPPHRCTKSSASRLFKAFPRLISYNPERLVVVLLTEEAWSSIKARLRPKTTFGVSFCTPESLNPPGYHVMALQAYPEADKTSTLHPHPSFWRECLAARKRSQYLSQ